MIRVCVIDRKNRLETVKTLRSERIRKDKKAMAIVESLFRSRYLVWALLAVPSIPMFAGLATGDASPHRLLHVSGETAARMMIVAMMITPLRMLFPKPRWLAWLARQRRALGVAAFFYAALHTLLYVVDVGTLQRIAADFWKLGIWTGWAAFFIFIPLAVTSNDYAVRLLKRSWKALHRWVYPAAVLTLVHWIFVENNLGPALVHFVPLALLEMYRVVRTGRPRATAGAG